MGLALKKPDVAYLTTAIGRKWMNGLRNQLQFHVILGKLPLTEAQCFL